MVDHKQCNIRGWRNCNWFSFDGERHNNQESIFATLHRQDFQEVKDYEPNNDLDNSLAPEIKDGVGKNNYNEGKKI